jgi:anti-sigma28 factor (negative regulator of flagellin synthesis)
MVAGFDGDCRRRTEAVVRLMKTNETEGTVTYFPVEKRKRERSGEARDLLTADQGHDDNDGPAISEEVLLKMLEKPFGCSGRQRRIEKLRERILNGTYHIPAIELAERLIEGDNF